ncbi:MAG: NUDIX domain-containing protein [Promethearchaeota archaeon]|nr:MAG: NUDIX domain-containing protein [Candidatus Lokiarchaeota archaeon]
MGDPRAYPEYPLIGVGTCLLKNNTILIIQRGHEPDKGLWSIPGGMVGYGERTEVAAAREVEEETGLKVLEMEYVADIVNKIIYDTSGKLKYHFIIVDYVTRKFEGTALAMDDAIDLEWCPFKELPKHDYPDTIVELFKKIHIWPEQ